MPLSMMQKNATTPYIFNISATLPSHCCSSNTNNQTLTATQLHHVAPKYIYANIEPHATPFCTLLNRTLLFIIHGEKKKCSGTKCQKW